MSRTYETTVRQALQMAQNSPTGELDPQILQILENYLTQLWGRIQAQPETYVMTVLEFAVFNLFRARAEFQNETARKAISRYWDSHTASNNTSNSEPQN
ncbi:uncharacterized protein Z520_07152 [Fonsecaea multimorphosa CBS 102226]|uniref:Importin N-terminal domain-containing protein n=1 Tax=Fonsecaea multimorphosa CBS 102226 TaxID=1442371 RepID=A0A0D2KK88_9EURO|nr:uncharacterized protein Z520_07152 [Fonsecaea multimorphosa CBS 102226]KIX97038.1 hypothetical protein Z520_07152 [Fonsecaea multimorphosa CBS 102226]